MANKFDPNPALYRRLPEPKTDFTTAGLAVQKFFDGLKQLREECGIADVTIAVEVPYSLNERVEAGAFAVYCLGDSAKHVAMLERAAEALSAQQDEGEGKRYVYRFDEVCAALHNYVVRGCDAVSLNACLGMREWLEYRLATWNWGEERSAFDQQVRSLAEVALAEFNENLELPSSATVDAREQERDR